MPFALVATFENGYNLFSLCYKTKVGASPS